MNHRQPDSPPGPRADKIDGYVGCGPCEVAKRATLKACVADLEPKPTSESLVLEMLPGAWEKSEMEL